LCLRWNYSHSSAPSGFQDRVRWLHTAWWPQRWSNPQPTVRKRMGLRIRPRQPGHPWQRRPLGASPRRVFSGGSCVRDHHKRPGPCSPSRGGTEGRFDDGINLTRLHRPPGIYLYTPSLFRKFVKHPLSFLLQVESYDKTRPWINHSIPLPAGFNHKSSIK